MSSDEDQGIPNGHLADTPPKATKVSRPTAGHPKYIDMLIEGIKALDEKKGASVIAIKHWINNTYPQLSHVSQATINNRLKMAIKRAYDSGQIVRPKKFEELGASLQGRFKLGKPPKPAKKAQKKKTEKKKKTGADGKKKKPAGSKKDRKKSEDIFDFANDKELEDDTEGSDPDGMKTPPPYKKGRAKKEPVEKLKSKKVVQRIRSASANATPKPRVHKSKALLRRSKSQSPAPSRVTSRANKKPASKSPAGKASKSPAKKAKAKAAAKKPKPKTVKGKSPSPKPAKKGKQKEPADKKKGKPPAKKALKGKAK